MQDTIKTINAHLSASCSAQETKQQPPRIPNRNLRWTLFQPPIVYCLSYAALNILQFGAFALGTVVNFDSLQPLL